MDRAHIEQQQVIERYVRGALTPDELAEFELYMLDHPETLDEVEYARGLQEAMLSEKDAFFVGTAPIQNAKRLWRAPPYALAATVLMCASLLSTVYLFRQNATLVAEAEALRGPSALSIDVWLEPMRGAQPLLVEQRPGDGLLLRVLVDRRSEGPYDVRIRSLDTAFVWNASRLTPHEENELLIAVRDLPFGRYELTASGAGAQAASTYTFDLVAAE